MILNIIFYIFVFVEDITSYQIKIKKPTSPIKKNETSRLNRVELVLDRDANTCAKFIDKDGAGAWLQVELDRVYTITDIRLLYSSERYVMKDIQEYKNISFMHVLDIDIGYNDSNKIDYKMCVHFGETYLYFPGRYINLTCMKAEPGNLVRFSNVNREILLCEIEVFADLKTVNLAYKRPFLQLGTLLSDTSDLSVDGDQYTCGVMKSVPNEMPWWRVILDDVYYVTDVSFSSKTPEEYWYLDRSVHIFVSNNVLNYEELLCATSVEIEILKGRTVSMTCSKPSPGRYVTLQKYHGDYPNILVLCEVQIFSRGYPAEISKEASHCLKSEYKCLEGECIHRDWLCDGIKDCPLFDDEAPSCTSNKNNFKCKKFNVSVVMPKRCDGVNDCFDFSDEENCFDLHSEYLTVTFKGKSNYYICGDHWDYECSASICNENDRDHNETKIIPIKEHMKFFIKLNKNQSSSNFMASVQESVDCGSKSIVDVKCSYRKERKFTCGRRDISDAFVGPYVLKGQEVKSEAWPWYVQIFHGKWFPKLMCGGSLIKNQWVLTSARCFDSFWDIDNLYVLIGGYVYDQYGKERHYVSHLIRHPFYNQDKDSPDNLYDMALLRLKSPVSHVKPICLPKDIYKEKTFKSFQYCVLIGFGHINRNGERPSVMHQARMNYVPNDVCANYINSISNMPLSEILSHLEKFKLFCAGQLPLKDSTNGCLGDNGSPLMCKDNNGVWTQTGIVRGYYLSDDHICSYTKFIHIDHYLDYINQVMNSDYNSAIVLKKPLFDLLSYILLGNICKHLWY